MRNTRTIKLCLTFIVALAAAVMAPTALAQNTDDPSDKQYNPPIPEQTGAAVGTAGDEDDGGDEAGTGLNATIGSLPFTGMDLLIVAGVAFLLTGTGFALRRLSTPKGPST